MVISNDGSLLAVITDHGVSLIQPNPATFVQFSRFDPSVFVNTSASPTKSWLRAYAHFALGNSSGLDLASDDLTLTVGSYVMTVPAGGFRNENGQYVYYTTGLSVIVRPSDGGSYGLEVAANGVSLAGSALPIQATLTIGPNQGSATLSNTQAHFFAFEGS